MGVGDQAFGYSTRVASFEQLRQFTAPLLGQPAVENEMLDARLVQPRAEHVKAILEGAEHKTLLPAFQHLPDEFQRRGDLRDVTIFTPGTTGLP